MGVSNREQCSVLGVVGCVGCKVRLCPVCVVCRTSLDCNAGRIWNRWLALGWAQCQWGGISAGIGAECDLRFY